MSVLSIAADVAALHRKLAAALLRAEKAEAQVRAYEWADRLRTGIGTKGTEIDRDDA